MHRILKAPAFPMWMAFGMWTAFIAVTKFWPASFWFDVQTVYVHDSKEDESVLMEVDRTIKRDFVGTWVVSVRKVDDGRREVVCYASSESNYRHGSDLPPVLTLGWWTNGRCDRLPVGKYVVSTDWNIHASDFWPSKRVSAESNVFEVTR